MRSNVKIQHYKNSFQTSGRERFFWNIFFPITVCANVDGKIVLRKKILASSFWGVCMQTFFNILTGDKNPILEIDVGILNCKTPDF